MAWCFRLDNEVERIMAIQTNSLIWRRSTASRASAKEKLLVLLGTDTSACSTFLKQMRLIHSYGFTANERLAYKDAVYATVFTALYTLIDACKTLNLYPSPSNEEAAARLQTCTELDRRITAQNEQDLRCVWEDAAIQCAFHHGHEFQVSEYTDYYFSSLERIARPDYVPSYQDILPLGTSIEVGIEEVHFSVEDFRFKMVNATLQRSGRRKWMHCFQDANAVLFCAALDEYEKKRSDIQGDGLHHSLQLFDEVCNSEFFIEACMIVFLTKDNQFRKRIEEVNLDVCFEDYPGPKNDYQASISFIQSKFIGVNQNAFKNIHFHATSIADSDNVAAIFQDVMNAVLRAALYKAGIL